MKKEGKEQRGREGEKEKGRGREGDERIGITLVHGFLANPFLCFSQFLVMTLCPLPSSQMSVFPELLLLALLCFLYKGPSDSLPFAVFHYYKYVSVIHILCLDLRSVASDS